MNLVPTASTTAALAIGDALAMTLCVEKGFRQEDFAKLHPGGKLGKRLMRVEALMHAGKHCPIVGANTPMRDVIYEMSRKGLGMTCVVEGSADEDVLLGIITDGDLRRHMERGDGILGLKAGDVMTRNPVSVPRSLLAAEALHIMEQRKITSIVVADGDAPKRVAGVVHLHDLWRMDLF
jgi:arabinose-5-phosphate isomerase